MHQISLIVPIFKNESQLPVCAASIRNQTHHDFSLYLVDDGSPDLSGALCDGYALADERIISVHKKNGGPGYARNAGIHLVSSKYVMFPDGDDICHPNMIETAYEAAIKDDVDLVIFNYENIEYDFLQSRLINRSSASTFPEEAKGEACRKFWFELRKVNISQLNTPWNKLYKTAIIQEHGIRFPQIRRAQDAVFNLFYYEKIGSVVAVDDVLYQYVTNDQANVWMKFPRDVIDSFCVFNEAMETVVKGWGLFHGEYKALCDNNMLGNVYDTVQLYKNPNWKLSVVGKYRYVKYVMSHPYVRKRFSDFDANVYELKRYIAPIRKQSPILFFAAMYLGKATGFCKGFLMRNKYVHSFLKQIKHRLRRNA